MKSDIERVAEAIFPLLSGDPEDDHNNKWVQEVATTAVRAVDTNGDYLSCRKTVAGLSGYPVMALTFDEHIAKIKAAQQNQVQTDHSELIKRANEVCKAGGITKVDIQTTGELIGLIRDLITALEGGKPGTEIKGNLVAKELGE